jgi:hypothetical protein
MTRAIAVAEVRVRHAEMQAELQRAAAVTPPPSRSAPAAGEQESSARPSALEICKQARTLVLRAAVELLDGGRLTCARDCRWKRRWLPTRDDESRRSWAKPSTSLASACCLTRATVCFLC